MNPLSSLPRATSLAHDLLARVLRPGDMAVDCTAGNGYDTVFLARAVAPGGHVLALDIQASAVLATRDRCHAAGLSPHVSVIQASHITVADCMGERGWERGALAAAVFNLGYLPGGDKAHITRSGTTLPALAAVLPWLRAGGLLSVVCYPGHPGGGEEAAAVEDWAAGLPGGDYLVARYGVMNSPAHPPFLLAIQRRRTDAAASDQETPT